MLDGRRISPRQGKGALTAEQARAIRRWIADRTPDQLKLPFALRTARGRKGVRGRKGGGNFFPSETAAGVPVRGVAWRRLGGGLEAAEQE